MSDLVEISSQHSLHRRGDVTAIRKSGHGRDIGERSGAVLQTAMPGHDASSRFLSSLSAQSRIGPAFDLGSPDHLLGLMGVERTGAGRPAFRQDLHGEQLGVDFRLERPGRSDRACCAVVRFHRFIRPEGHVPDIGMRHFCITPMAGESFRSSLQTFACRKAAAVAGGNRSLELSHPEIIDRFERSAEELHAPTGGIPCSVSGLTYYFVRRLGCGLAGREDRARYRFWHHRRYYRWYRSARLSPVGCFRGSASTWAPASSRRSSIRLRSALSCSC